MTRGLWKNSAVVMTVTAMCLVLAFCVTKNDNNNNDQGNNNNENQNNVQVDAAVDASVIPQNDAAVPPPLTSGHTGWDRADCAACHPSVQPIPHGTDYEFWECAACHGSNNAPSQSSGHGSDPCTSCHGSGAPWNSATHGAYANFDGTQCFGCHNP